MRWREPCCSCAVPCTSYRKLPGDAGEIGLRDRCHERLKRPRLGPDRLKCRLWLISFASSSSCPKNIALVDEKKTFSVFWLWMEGNEANTAFLGSTNVTFSGPAAVMSEARQKRISKPTSTCDDSAKE